MSFNVYVGSERMRPLKSSEEVTKEMPNSHGTLNKHHALPIYRIALFPSPNTDDSLDWKFWSKIWRGVKTGSERPSALQRAQPSFPNPYEEKHPPLDPKNNAHPSKHDH